MSRVRWTGAALTATPSVQSRRLITGPLRAIPEPPIQTGPSSPPAAVNGKPNVTRAGNAVALALASLVVVALGRDTGPARFALAPVSYDRLSGWAADRLSAAIPVFLKSCGKILTRGDAAALDTGTMSADFGRVGDWRALCETAKVLSAGDDQAARRFFETGFLPLAVADYGTSEGLFTGYYEVELN